MPTFFSDPPRIVLLAAAAFVIVAGAVWFGRRDSKSLTALVVAIGLVAVVFLIDSMFESPREESVRRVTAMAKAADGRDPEAFVAHLADSFEYRGESGQPVTLTREQIRKAGFWNVLKQYNAHVAVWDFSRDDVLITDDKTVEIGFLAKGEAEGKQLPMYFRAKFSRQPDGQMKLTGLASFDPVRRQKGQMSIPYFP